MNSAVVVVCDGLSSRYLGPYGNASVMTSTWNRLAADSNLFEFAIIDDPRLERIYRSFFSGRHAVARQTVARQTVARQRDSDLLLRRLRERGVQSVLVSDDETIGQLAEQVGFDSVFSVVSSSTGPVEDVAESKVAELFATAMDWLENAREPYLLWVHSRGMLADWDAPYSLRCESADEEDPEPPTDVTPPDFLHDATIDADVLLGWRQAYSAQVMMWDMCLEPFVDHLSLRPEASNAALVLTASRGYPLGEHGRVGICDLPLFGELIQVPLLWRFPDRQGASLRHQQLTQPMDLCHSLLDWFGCLESSESSAGPTVLATQGQSFLPVCHDLRQPWRDRAVTIAPGQKAIRTASWQVRVQTEIGERHLFAKPEDVWERNDVADRCEEEVRQLEGLLDEFLEIAASDTPRALTPLPEGLEAAF